MFWSILSNLKCIIKVVNQDNSERSFVDKFVVLQDDFSQTCVSSKKDQYMMQSIHQ